MVCLIYWALYRVFEGTRIVQLNVSESSCKTPRWRQIAMISEICFTCIRRHLGNQSNARIELNHERSHWHLRSELEDSMPERLHYWMHLRCNLCISSPLLKYRLRKAWYRPHFGVRTYIHPYVRVWASKLLVKLFRYIIEVCILS